MSLIETAGFGATGTSSWQTAPEYQCTDLDVNLSTFREVSYLLLERPNLNSSHLFRADILYDSLGILKTITDREYDHGHTTERPPSENFRSALAEHGSSSFAGFTLEQTVLRKLIPRKPRLDTALDQSCLFFASSASAASVEKVLVVYVPHVNHPQEIPWYHPQVRALAYLFEKSGSHATISVHYKPFLQSDHDQSSRIDRTMLSLLQTLVRLTKMPKPTESKTSNVPGPVSMRSTAPAAIKDTLLPQHVVQDTYTRLKETYASDLMARWVEKTEPSKHVFEDLSIAAFLIELWKQMYGNDLFPGFVDLACGNGVLVYILIKEGYQGFGFDARRRKTWEILGIDAHLEERICIPAPFLDAMRKADDPAVLPAHNGIFKPETFIISNHADELTLWTPILAVLSNPEMPLPFLAIPCCSHRLSGARYRYRLKDIDGQQTSSTSVDSGQDTHDSEPQSSQGDLRALRVHKQNAAQHSSDKSQYACLTWKTVAIAEEVGHTAEMTLMRIPSTRNIGVVGNRNRSQSKHLSRYVEKATMETDMIRVSVDGIHTLLERECQRDGGIEAAAQQWLARARKLQESSGRGKVNLKGRKPTTNGSPTTAKDDLVHDNVE